jgi:hypothetical protein
MVRCFIVLMMNDINTIGRLFAQVFYSVYANHQKNIRDFYFPNSKKEVIVDEVKFTCCGIDEIYKLNVTHSFSAFDVKNISACKINDMITVLCSGTLVKDAKIRLFTHNFLLKLKDKETNNYCVLNEVLHVNQTEKLLPTRNIQTVPTFMQNPQILYTSSGLPVILSPYLPPFVRNPERSCASPGYPTMISNTSSIPSCGRPVIYNVTSSDQKVEIKNNHKTDKYSFPSSYKQLSSTTENSSPSFASKKCYHSTSKNNTSNKFMEKNKNNELYTLSPLSSSSSSKQHQPKNHLSSSSSSSPSVSSPLHLSLSSSSPSVSSPLSRNACCENNPNNSLNSDETSSSISSYSSSSSSFTLSRSVSPRNPGVSKGNFSPVQSTMLIKPSSCYLQDIEDDTPELAETLNQKYSTVIKRFKSCPPTVNKALLSKIDVVKSRAHEDEPELYYRDRTGCNDIMVSHKFNLIQKLKISKSTYLSKLPSSSAGCDVFSKPISSPPLSSSSSNSLSSTENPTSINTISEHSNHIYGVDEISSFSSHRISHSSLYHYPDDIW